MSLKTYILLLLLIASNAYWLFKYNEDRKVIKVLLESVEKYAQQNSVINMHKNDRLYELEFNGLHLSDSLSLTDVEGKKWLLKDLIDSPKLILRYSNLNCHTCIDEQLKNLKSFADSAHCSDKILLFTTCETDVYMRQFKRANKIHFPIFNLGKLANEQLRDIGMPYMFVLSPQDNRIQCMFVPQKELPNLTDSCLIMLREKFL